MILSKPTALEALAAERYKKQETSVREYCQYGTRFECYREMSLAGTQQERCRKLHFRRVLESHTDPSLGDCAYLATCRRTRTCKYIHYEIEDDEEVGTKQGDVGRGKFNHKQRGLKIDLCAVNGTSDLEYPNASAGLAAGATKAGGTAAILTTSSTTTAPQTGTKIPVSISTGLVIDVWTTIEKDKMMMMMCYAQLSTNIGTMGQH